MRDKQDDSRARERLRKLWQPGDLFHVFSRYPRRRGAPKSDRLAGILKHGILAPATCADGSVCSDLHILASGLAVPYDSLVFLHRFGAKSWLYTICDPGRLAVFIDPGIAVLTPEDMGADWPLLCQDEVYVRDRIEVHKILGIAVHPDDAGPVLTDFRADLRRLGIPLYLYDGKAVWPKKQHRRRT